MLGANCTAARKSMIAARCGATNMARGIPMATTLTITVDYRNHAFTYALSYTDASGTAWVGTIVDQGTIAFTNSGKYTLKDGAGSSSTFTFDGLTVVNGSTLSGLNVKKCDGSVWTLSNIPFPAIPADETKCHQPHSWCQQLPKSSEPLGPEYKDPKLGLSNTTGNSPHLIDFSGVSCNCAAGSGHA